MGLLFELFKRSAQNGRKKEFIGIIRVKGSKLLLEHQMSNFVVQIKIFDSIWRTVQTFFLRVCRGSHIICFDPIRKASLDFIVLSYKSDL